MNQNNNSNKDNTNNTDDKLVKVEMNSENVEKKIKKYYSQPSIKETPSNETIRRELGWFLR